MVTCAQIDVNQCMAGDLRIAGGFEESRCAAEFARYAAFDGTARTAATTGGAGSGSGGAACRLCRIRRRTAITADRGRLIIETEMTFMVRLPSSGDAWERFERTVSHIGSFSNRSPGVIRKPTRTPVQQMSRQTRENLIVAARRAFYETTRKIGLPRSNIPEPIAPRTIPGHRSGAIR
jgi:hypothetical protein